MKMVVLSRANRRQIDLKQALKDRGKIMIRCFNKSKTIFAAGLVCTVALAVAAGAQRTGYPLWVLGITVGLVLLLGISFSKLLAGMVASQCSQKLLAVLHIALMPEQFVEAYACVPQRAARGSTARVITAAYLADGYCAMGQPQKALDTLVWEFETKKPSARPTLEGLLLHNQCRYLLHCGDAQGASDAADRLQKAVEQLRQQNTALAQNLSEELRFYRIWVDLLNGQSVDMAYLEQKLKQLPTNIARMEVCWVLAQHCQNSNQPDKAGEYLRRIAAEGGGLALAQKARRLLEQGN